jgi:hypothetical protein
MKGRSNPRKLEAAPGGLFLSRTSSGSLAIFAAIRRAPRF